MILQKNPFYVLNITCSDSRRVIASAIDQLSLVNDTENYGEAQNILINPKKRLSAEIDWFVDLDRSAIEEIRTHIQKREPINTDNLTSLSKLNASLHNFTLIEEIDPLLIRYDIIDVDEQYSELDIEEITRLINTCRSAANMVSIQVQDVSFEIGRKRNSISQVITNKLAKINGDEYIELITMLANDYSELDDYHEGVIISAILNQYEIRMQSEIEGKTANITSYIERLKGTPPNISSKDDIQRLIRKVQEWDVLVQPLQLKSMATGMPHPISEEMGAELRSLALYLHNERGKSEEALTLVEAMQDTFAELGQTFAIFKSDSDVLRDLIQGSNDAEEVLTEMNSLSELSENLKNDPQTFKIEDFITRVKRLDVKIRSLVVDGELKTKVRRNLCYMARDVAISLHNEKQQTSKALLITRALSNEFGDIFDLYLKLSEEIVTLNEQLRLKDEYQTLRAQQQHAQMSKNSGCLIFTGIFVLIIIIASILGNSSDPISSTKVASQSSTSTQSNKVDTSRSVGTSVVSRKVQLENELNKLDQDISSMETKLGIMDIYINELEDQLDDLTFNIDYYEQQYKNTGLSTYYNSYYDSVDLYNLIYKDYSSKIDEYNDLYDDYSVAIVEYNKKANEYNNLD